MGLHVFSSRGNMVGGSVLRSKNRVLIVDRFALRTSAGGKGHPSCVGTTGPSISVPLCRRFYGSLDNTLKGRVNANVFKTSVGIRLLGSNPIAVYVSAGGGRWWLAVGGCSSKEDARADKPVNRGVQYPLLRQISRCNDSRKENEEANTYRNPRV